MIRGNPKENVSLEELDGATLIIGKSSDDPTVVELGEEQ